MSAIKREVVIGNARLLLGDCLEILPLLGKVDAVVTDPPYGISWQSNHNGKRKKFAKILGDESVSTEFIGHLDADVIYCFTRWDVLSEWVAAIPNVKDVLVWDKKSHGAGDLSSYAPCYELIIYAPQKRTSLLKGRKQNVLRHWRVDGGATGISSGSLLTHPAEKPVALLADIIENHDSHTILDCYMGSGTTGVACVKLGRSFIGIEIDEGYFDIACRRIQDAYDRPDMFIAPRAPDPVQQPLFGDAAA